MTTELLPRKSESYVIDPQAILESSTKKEPFAIKVDKSYLQKFNEIFGHYQTQMKYGKLYKHQIFMLIVDEAWNRLKQQNKL